MVLSVLTQSTTRVSQQRKTKEMMDDVFSLFGTFTVVRVAACLEAKDEESKERKLSGCH